MLILLHSLHIWEQKVKHNPQVLNEISDKVDHVMLISGKEIYA